jgi:hypothetical protein
MVESKFNCNSIGILHQIRGLWQEQWRNIRESSTFEMKIQADLNALQFWHPPRLRLSLPGNKI